MKNNNFIIMLTVIVVIVSSLFPTKIPTKIIQENRPENSLNPNGENVKVLGESTERSLKNVKNKKTEKLNFETQKLYSLINSYRKDNKLTPLSVNKSLELSSKRKVEDMINSNYFKHKDKNGLESWYLFKIAGYEFKTAGENLSSGANTPWKVFDAWKNSKTHNEQLLNPTYLDMGITADCESYKISNLSSCIVVLHLGSR